MACKHPLKAFCIGYKDNGKKELLIRPYAVDHLEKRNGKWTDSYVHGFVSQQATAVCRDFDEIPCGKCIGCRLEYSRQWANRCLLELQYHKSAYFVTLTYDDLHAPETWYGDPDTGEAKRAYTLRKRDFQLFMKRLRKQTGQELRYFAAGEYGSKTFRPHYHAIIYGLELNDLEFYKVSELGFNYYNSPLVNRAWSCYNKDKRSITPLGFAVVAEVTWETCAYTARYTAKKNNTEGEDYFQSMNLEPPFTLMSRRPGIGAQYFEDHPELFEHAYINVATEKGGRKFRSPKYFFNLLERENPALASDLKAQRKELMDKSHALKLQNTDLSYLDLLEVEEEALIARTKCLERRL
uniref:Replication initiator protein n=1 Tax=Dulem virus 154 TaxID=3145631 RepID=A0AAU8B0E5_9VIRU